MLALNLRKFSEIPVPPQKIKGIEYQVVLIAPREFSLESGEISSAVFNDDHLPVGDSLSGNIQSAGNDGKPFRPVQPVAGVDLLPSPVQVDFLKVLWPSGWQVAV